MTIPSKPVVQVDVFSDIRCSGATIVWAVKGRPRRRSRSGRRRRAALECLTLPPARLPSLPLTRSCPWCWVGKRRFDAALEQLGGEAEFAVRYHAYVIDHKTAKGGACCSLAGWRAGGAPAGGSGCGGRAPAHAAPGHTHPPQRASPRPPAGAAPPSPGEEYLAYNVRRWGGDGWCADLRRSGARDGAAFADWRWWPNSVGGHQLILYAQERGLGRQMKDLLLRKT